MVYKSFSLNKRLARFVDSIYYYESSSNSETSITIIPDGKIDVNIILDDKPKYIVVDSKSHIIERRAIIVGTYSKTIECIMPPNSKIIGIRLYPTSVKILFGLPGKVIPPYPTIFEPLDSLSLSSLTVNNTDEIEFALNSVAGELEKFIPQTNKEDLLHDFVKQIYETKGIAPLNELCNYSSSDYKKLQRLFFAEIGIKAKMFSRMVRFEAIHNEIMRTVGIDWQNMIAKYDFHDQSHFIKECRFFTGLSPKMFYKKLEVYI